MPFLEVVESSAVNKLKDGKESLLLLKRKKGKYSIRFGMVEEHLILVFKMDWKFGVHHL